MHNDKLVINWFSLDKSCCVWAIVVVFGQTWSHLDKLVVIGQYIYGFEQQG